MGDPWQGSPQANVHQKMSRLRDNLVINPSIVNYEKK